MEHKPPIGVGTAFITSAVLYDPRWANPRTVQVVRTRHPPDIGFGSAGKSTGVHWQRGHDEGSPYSRFLFFLREYSPLL
jgi:hypothetical protein